MLTKTNSNKTKYYILFLFLLLLFLGLGITLYIVNKPEYDDCLDLYEECSRVCQPSNCAICSTCNITCSYCTECTAYNSTFCIKHICPTISNCINCRSEYTNYNCDEIRHNFGSFTVILALGIIITGLYCLAGLCKVCRT